MKNTVHLIGHLGNDVTIKNFENGGTAGNFNVATNESYKNKDGEKVENTEWHQVVVNGELANVCSKFIHKGSLVSITGKLRTRSWEEEGIKRYSTEVIANDVVFLDKKPQ